MLVNIPTASTTVSFAAQGGGGLQRRARRRARNGPRYGTGRLHTEARDDSRDGSAASSVSVGERIRYW